MKSYFVGFLVLLIVAGAVVGLGYLVRERAAKQAEQQFHLGQSFVEKGDDKRARDAFMALIEDAPRSEHVESALAHMGGICERSEAYESALEYWSRLESDFPAGTRTAEAIYHIGFCLEQLGRHEEAIEMYSRAGEGSDFYVSSQCGLGRVEEAGGNLKLALGIYKAAVNAADENTDEYRDAVDHLGGLNTRLLFSKAPTENSVLYRVKSGDSISSIGEKFSVTKASIMRANGMQPDTPLRINRTLKITPVEYRLDIDMDEFRLRLYANDELFNEYSVGLGRPDNPTIPGKYVIDNKIVNPTWYSPRGKVYPPGDPENELGTRWMGLQPLEPDLPTDLGIHGTIDPSTVGWASSSGCPRMLPDEAEELFDILPLRTPVEIHE